MVKNRIGIMQGRLSLPCSGKIQSFPKETWMNEFKSAKSAGLNFIEWIFEADEWEKNPIATDRGIDSIIGLKKENHIDVPLLCADYFMDIPYLKSSDNVKKELIEMLDWLIERSSKMGVKYIDIPFVDNSKIENKSMFSEVVSFISPVLNSAVEKGITLTLEASLNPEDFLELLELFNHPNVKANYDTGNSSGIGYDPVEELSSYGEYVRTIHIKDRVINNGTVPLGAGSAEFDKFFKQLKKLNYNGPFVLQAAREKEGQEIDTAIKNRKFVESYLSKYFL